jgi:hypothetical protein
MGTRTLPLFLMVKTHALQNSWSIWSGSVVVAGACWDDDEDEADGSEDVCAKPDIIAQSTSCDLINVWSIGLEWELKNDEREM